MKRIVIWITLVALLTMCFAGCSEESAKGASNVTAEETVYLAEVLAPQRCQIMKSGETLQLTISQEDVTTITSSNEKVATVSNSGLVTAVGKGMALITVSNGDDSATCGVLVDPAGSMIDVTKLTRKEIFTDLELHAGTQITGISVDAANQAMYIAQTYGANSYVPLNSETLVNKVEAKGDTWELAGWMRFSGSGKGTVCVDNDGATPRLWLESNGDYIGYGKSVSLVEWSDGGYGQDTYGQTFAPQGISGGMTVTADVENNMVLIYDRAEKCYRIYDREQMLAGEEASEYVYTFACKSNQTPVAGEDDSQGRYNASIRGYALHDGYIYQFSGSSSVYVSVFDLEGTLQYCHRLENLPEVDYYMPAGISVSQGKIYVVIASGSSDYNFANLLVFE